MKQLSLVGNATGQYQEKGRRYSGTALHWQEWGKTVHIPSDFPTDDFPGELGLSEKHTCMDKGGDPLQLTGY